MKNMTGFMLLVLLMVFGIPSGYSQDQPKRLDFSGATAEENQITLMGAGFGQYTQAAISFGSIPQDNAFPGATDGNGAIITANPNEGIMIFAPIVQTSYAALIRCSVRADRADAQVVIATIDQGPNVFVSTNTPNNGQYFLNQYKRLTTFHVPASTGFQPLIQVFNASKTDRLTVYLDHLDVYLLDPDKFYSAKFLSADLNDPEIISVTPSGIQTPLPTQIPTFTPTNTPTPTYTPTSPPVPPATPTPSAGTPAETALNRINALRSLVGISPLTLHDALVKAAAAHSHYMAVNRELTHVEDPAKSQFVAANPWDRAAVFGYTYANFSEGAGYYYGYSNRTAADNVDSQIAGPYHRKAPLNSILIHFGYGEEKSDNGNTYYTLDFGSTGGGTMKTVFYPGENQTDVPLTFDGNESPNPYPDATYPVGYAVTLYGSQIQIQSYSLRPVGGTDLSLWTLLPSTSNTTIFAMSAKNPLSANTQYEASIAATVNGQSFNRTWRFTTAALKPAKMQERDTGHLPILPPPLELGK